MIHRSIAGLAAALLLAAPAAAAPPTPPSAYFQFGLESAAQADGPGSLLFNPAAGRYRNEMALTWIDHPHDKDAGRVAINSGPLLLSASGEREAAITPAIGLTGGSDRFRIGGVATWMPIEGGGRVRDYRAGALLRPEPWLSIGGVADHLSRPTIAGAYFGREYTVGVGVRPLAISRSKAHTWGTRWTLTADARFPAGDEDRQYRFGSEIEVVHGLLIRGVYLEHDRSFQLGVSLLGVRSGYHGQSRHDEGGESRLRTHSLSFHKEEDRTVLVPPGEKRVAAVRIGGDLADEPLAGVTLFGGIQTTPVGPIHRQLRRALEDPLTRGVLLDLRGSAGSAQIEELRAWVGRLRAAGKPVVAFMEYGGRRPDLYLASACDQIVTTPDANFPGLGLRAEQRYYRKPLADAGVHIDRTSYGKYKSAYRNYAADSMPEPDRESIEQILDTAQELFVATVARERGIERERLLAVLDGRWWSSRELQKAGLVDSVGYREDALRMLGQRVRLGSRPRTVQLARLPQARREWAVPTRLAVVYASGAIERGRSGNDLFSGPTLGSETITRQIEQAFKNRAVKAVVLRVESPGGSSIASSLIHRAILRMKRETEKPLVVSMGKSAASGGYHIACDADRILANRYTATGSIGVLLVKPSFENWHEQHGVTQVEIERGRYMRGWSAHRDWDAEIQASADSATYREYRDFVTVVAAGRRMTWDEVDAVAQGRVWLGADALERRLVDRIGGLEDAIAEARRLAGIPAEEKIALAEYRRPRPGIVQRIVGGAMSQMSGGATGQMIGGAMDQITGGGSLREPGQMLFLMDEAVPIP